MLLYPHKSLRRTRIVAGAVELLYIHAEHGGVENRRRYRISKSMYRQWEIAIYDYELSDWVLSSGGTPEGVFPSFTAAHEALRNYLGVKP